MSTWTMHTHLDSVLDVAPQHIIAEYGGEPEKDYIWDIENDELLSLEDGLSDLYACLAYSFEHEGFSEEEAQVLENLFVEFAGADPGFNNEYYEAEVRTGETTPHRPKELDKQNSR